MTQAVLYSRFSPRPDESTETITVQLEACRRYCAQRDVTVRAEYADEAISGAQEKRRGLTDAILALRRGDWLVVYALDRLARDIGLQEGQYLRQLNAIGVTLHAATEGDLSDPLMRQFRGIIAEENRRRIKRRTSEAMQSYQRAGRLMGSLPPYGWRIGETDENGRRRLIEDPDEQKVISLVLERVRKGKTVGGTTRWLNETGYTNRIGNPWQHNSVKRIVKRAQSDTD